MKKDKRECSSQPSKPAFALSSSFSRRRSLRFTTHQSCALQTQAFRQQPLLFQNHPAALSDNCSLPLKVSSLREAQAAFVRRFFHRAFGSCLVRAFLLAQPAAKPCRNWHTLKQAFQNARISREAFHRLYVLDLLRPDVTSGRELSSFMLRSPRNSVVAVCEPQPDRAGLDDLQHSLVATV